MSRDNFRDQRTHRPARPYPTRGCPRACGRRTPSRTLRSACRRHGARHLAGLQRGRLLPRHGRICGHRRRARPARVARRPPIARSRPRAARWRSPWVRSRSTRSGRSCPRTGPTRPRARSSSSTARCCTSLLLVAAGLMTGRLGGPGRVVWGLAAAAFVICGAGLITRVLPDVWPIRATLQADRLSYPDHVLEHARPPRRDGLGRVPAPHVVAARAARRPRARRRRAAGARLHRVLHLLARRDPRRADRRRRLPAARAPARRARGSAGRRARDRHRRRRVLGRRRPRRRRPHDRDRRRPGPDGGDRHRRLHGPRRRAAPRARRTGPLGRRTRDPPALARADGRDRGRRSSP